MVKFAKAWRYDHDKQQFLLQLSDHVPRTRAVIRLEATSGPTAIATMDISPSVELRIPLLVKENEWISGELRIGAHVMDTFGCRTDRVTCPHCKHRLDNEPDLSELSPDLVWSIDTQQLVVFNARRRFVASSMDDASWLVWYLNFHLADFDRV